MERSAEKNYLLKYIEEQQAHGKYTFSFEDLKNYFKNASDAALKLALNRISKRGKILPVHKGFYSIIPPEYSKTGIVPPARFVDQLMKHLEKPYYVGLLSAAAIHGAAHQQPQEFFVITTTPPLRAKLIRGLKINFVTRIEIPREGLEDKQTETGFIKVSSPELTVIDIVQYERRIGGLDRAVTVLDELFDCVEPEKLGALLKSEVPVSVLQRLGYIAEKVLRKRKVSSILHDCLGKKRLSRVPLKAGGGRSGYRIDPDWQVIVNGTVERAP